MQCKVDKSFRLHQTSNVLYTAIIHWEIGLKHQTKQLETNFERPSYSRMTSVSNTRRPRSVRVSQWTGVLAIVQFPSSALLIIRCRPIFATPAVQDSRGSPRAPGAGTAQDGPVEVKVTPLRPKNIKDVDPTLAEKSALSGLLCTPLVPRSRLQRKGKANRKIVEKREIGLLVKITSHYMGL